MFPSRDHHWRLAYGLIALAPIVAALAFRSAGSNAPGTSGLGPALPGLVVLLPAGVAAFVGALVGGEKQKAKGDRVGD